ncbi:conjugal transfer protein [Photobacterium damselae]|uniref:conjugal transfer protein n=1 Tax=Photobacterium damselae TaxID=38293 RepID=UPI001F5B054E|nr:conjugal transfer protein [Photobacterium damselae]
MKKQLLPLMIISLVGTMTPLSATASDADCAIWLCLPTGFPSGCSDAKSAFIKRIKKFKPPLPNIVSCLISSSDIPPEISNSFKPSEMTYKEGIAAKMGEDTYIDGRRCVYRRHHHEIIEWSPFGCIGTYHFIQTYMDGKPYGEKYYYNY